MVDDVEVVDATCSLKDCESMPRSAHVAVLVPSSANVSAISPPSDSYIPYFCKAAMIVRCAALNLALNPALRTASSKSGRSRKLTP